MWEEASYIYSEKVEDISEAPEPNTTYPPDLLKAMMVPRESPICGSAEYGVQSTSRMTPSLGILPSHLGNLGAINAPERHTSDAVSARAFGAALEYAKWKRPRG